jgi:hypothetical protein
MPQRLDDLEISMHPLQSVAILDVPINNRVLILIKNKSEGE